MHEKGDKKHARSPLCKKRELLQEKTGRNLHSELGRKKGAWKTRKEERGGKT